MYIVSITDSRGMLPPGDRRFTRKLFSAADRAVMAAEKMCSDVLKWTREPDSGVTPVDESHRHVDEENESLTINAGTYTISMGPVDVEQGDEVEAPLE